MDAPAAIMGADGAVQDHAYVGPGLLAYDYGGPNVQYAGLQYTRDALGRVTQENRFWDDGTAHSSDPVGYTYNARGQRLQITYPNSGPVVSYTYNPDSSMNEVKQAGNVVAQYGYDTAGRVSTLTRKTTAGATVAASTYGYDGLGLPKTVTHTGPSNSSALGTGLGSISYTRNRLSEPTQIDETNPLKTSPSSTSLLDATIENNSLSGISGGTTPTIITTGALQGQYSAKVTVASSYLQKTLTTAVDEVYGSFLLKIDSTPSSTTRIAAILNGSVTELELQLTTSNRLRLRDNGVTIGSDSAALAVGTTYRVGFHQKKGSGANGVMEAWVAAGDALPVTAFASSSTENLTAQAAQVRIGATTSTAAAVTLDTFQLDSAQWPVQLSGAKSKAYAHDGLGRVITAPSETFSYDASGNILSNATTLNGVTYTSADQGDAFSYDNRGNLTGDAANSYTLVYDDLDRLTARSLTGGSSVDTTSLYAGRTLLGETRATGVTTYTQSTGSGGLSQILQTRTGAGAATSYIYGQSGERLFEFSGSTRTWDLADERGSLRSQVSDSGVPSGRASYSAYGLQSREGTITSPFAYLGEQFDPTWDMGWMRDRWYATGYGFFLGRDTLHNGENPYRYAYDSPLMLSDRNGECVPYLTPGCQWIGSWRDVNYGDAERYWTTVAQTAGYILVSPVDIVSHAMTAEGQAEYWRGWGAVWNHPLWSAQTILQAQLEPFGEVYQGWLCGNEEMIARGLVGSAFALWGADELLARGGKWFGKGEMREMAFASTEEGAGSGRIIAEMGPSISHINAMIALQRWTDAFLYGVEILNEDILHFRS